MRIAIRILRHRKASTAEVQDWFNRFRKLASGLSTTRMALRLFGGIEQISYFIKQIKAYRANCK